MSCCKCHRSATIAVVSGNVVITLATPAVGVIDTDPICFKLCQEIPTAGYSLPVVLVVNGVNVPLWNKFGDIVVGSRLVGRCELSGWYGVQGSDGHVILNSALRNSPCCCQG